MCNGRREIDKQISSEKIKRLEEIGRWPPPNGLTVLPEVEPEEETISMMLKFIKSRVSPRQARLLERASIEIPGVD
ncbi:MAG: hypothetical protein JXA42_22595 [Anaerolineales bacterium]|nr:hypothetical protein [Anaerolineales bacterium]